MTSEARIEAVVREAALEIARLATAGGARASLAGVTGQVLVELTSELTRLGLTKQVVADMLGMAPRTHHRRVQQARGAQVERRTVRDEVLEFVRASGQVTAHEVQQQFLRHPGELVAGVLHDLVHCGLARRRGWGDTAVYCAAASVASLPVTLGSCEPVRQVRVAGQRR